jgi:hypothetical protein
LLDRFTTNGLTAGVVRYTEQAFVSGPVRDEVPHETALSDGVPADVPVPVRLIETAGLVEESLLTITCPVCVPLAAGAKCTFTLRVPPGLMVTGRAPPPSRENEFPLTFIFETFTGEELWLTRETLDVPFWPMGTLPKVTASGEGLSAPAAPGFRTTPPQPDAAQTRQEARILMKKGEGRWMNRWSFEGLFVSW